MMLSCLTLFLCLSARAPSAIVTAEVTTVAGTSTDGNSGDGERPIGRRYHNLSEL